MSPFEQIEAAYAKHPKEEPFQNYVLHYARHGFVFSRPDFFCMGRAVKRTSPPEQILDPRVLFPKEECDCWYVMAAAGRMSQMWQVVPWPLEWFCWTRLHDPLAELTFSPTETLTRLCPPDINNPR